MNRFQTSCDLLETRVLFAVSQDSGGWTVVTPAADTQVIYVSSSAGNDANNGLSESTAVATLTRAKSLVRNGFADWMLLKRGDVFGTFGTWNKWGRSVQEPMLVGAYGTGVRPQINSGNTYGLNTVTSSNPNGVENIIFSSLSFFPDTYNHSNGAGDLSALRLTAKGRNILIEDCRAAGYKDNIVIAGETSTGVVTDVVVRRSQILDSHAASTVGNGNAQGIYVGAAGQRVTIEQNVLDHNGWRANTTGDRTDKNHNIYVQTGAAEVVIRDNINTQAGFYGAKLNGGGTVTGNFFARNSESVYMQAHTHAEGNVVTEAVDLDRTPTVATVTPWGVGINTQSSPSAVIRHNLITKVLSTNASGVAGIQLFNQSGVAFGGTVDFNTVYSWRNGLLINAAGAGPGSIQIHDNDLQAVFASTAAAAQRSTAPASTFAFSRNVYSSGTASTANKIGNNLVNFNTWVSSTGETAGAYQTISYPDPNRSIGDYNASLGGAATFDAFIAAARGSEKATWNSAYTAAAVNPWFWDGFDTAQPPAVLAGRFEAEKLPLAVHLTFNKDVGASLASGDILVQNTSTSTIVTAALEYSSSSAIGRLTFSSPLPDGNYRVTIPAGTIADRAGRPSAVEQQFDFFSLAGDSNRDRIVNLDDFTNLAANFGLTGRVFSHGDLNYSGGVDLDDFTVLASQFGKSLPASSTLPRGGAVGLVTRDPSAPPIVARTGNASPTQDRRTIFNDVWQVESKIA